MKWRHVMHVPPWHLRLLQPRNHALQINHPGVEFNLDSSPSSEISPFGCDCPLDSYFSTMGAKRGRPACSDSFLGVLCYRQSLSYH